MTRKTMTALRNTGSAALGLLAVACASAPDARQDAALCAGAGLAIHTDFDGAGQHGCALTAEGPVLTVWPEPAPAGPINPSPWYAFDLVGEPGTSVTVRLDYGPAEHRYAPWLQGADGQWTRLDANAVDVTDEGRLVSLALPVNEGRVRVSAQPVRAPADVETWSDAMASRYAAEQITYGYSQQGRPLTALLAGPETAGRLIVLMTGQHPPEHPGARAFEVAAEALLRAVPADTRLVLMPLTNPDGAALGYWRHTAAGIDPNRDWHAATLPEIRAAQSLVLDQLENRDLTAFLDFHATRETLVYTPPFDTPLADMSLARSLRSALDRRLGRELDWIAGHNTELGTSKNWALRTLGVAGLTIELADDAGEAEIRKVGEAIADTLAGRSPSGEPADESGA